MVKWSNPGKGVASSRVAIEKVAFWSPSIPVANFTYSYVAINILWSFYFACRHYQE